MMEILYLPISGNKPVAVNVKGHRMLILSPDEEVLNLGLDRLGADGVEAIVVGDTVEEQVETINKLAESINGGVIVAPADVQIEDVVNSLSQQLPWIH